MGLGLGLGLRLGVEEHLLLLELRLIESCD